MEVKPLGRNTDTLSLTSSQLGGIRRLKPAAVARQASQNRLYNQELILRELLVEGQLTRPELAHRFGLSAPTISSLVGDLIGEGLLRDAGTVETARVGKPPSAIEIDADGNVFLALDLTGNDHFSGAVVTIDGRIITRQQLDHAGATGPDAVAKVIKLVETLAAQTTAQVLGVGIASPGLVDGSGVVRQADRLGWIDLDLATAVRESTGHAVIVGNDVNFLALGLDESETDTGRDTIVVALDNGVGAALRLQGTVFEGEQYMVGEIGHVTVDTAPDSEVCICGRRGCLDPQVNGRYLRPRLQGIADVDEATLRSAAAALSRVIDPVVSMLNVGRVVLVGAADLYEGAFLDEMTRRIRDHNLPALTERVNVVIHDRGDDLILRGATRAMLRQRFATAAERGVS